MSYSESSKYRPPAFMYSLNVFLKLWTDLLIGLAENCPLPSPSDFQFRNYFGFGLFYWRYRKIYDGSFFLSLVQNTVPWNLKLFLCTLLHTVQRAVSMLAVLCCELCGNCCSLLQVLMRWRYSWQMEMNSLLAVSNCIHLADIIIQQCVCW